MARLQDVCHYGSLSQKHVHHRIEGVRLVKGVSGQAVKQRGTHLLQFQQHERHLVLQVLGAHEGARELRPRLWVLEPCREAQWVSELLASTRMQVLQLGKAAQRALRKGQLREQRVELHAGLLVQAELQDRRVSRSR